MSIDHYIFLLDSGIVFCNCKVLLISMQIFLVIYKINSRYELWQGDLWLRDQYGWYQYIDFKTDDQFVQCWSRLGRASPLMGHAPVPLYI